MIRTYASLSPLRFECPACTLLILFGRPGPHQDQYDKLTSILTCPSCARKYQLGIIAWEVAKGTRRAIPRDLRPTIKQLAVMRGYAGGFWMDGEVKKREDEVHRVVEEGCSCAPLAWREGCAVHGKRTQVDAEEE